MSCLFWGCDAGGFLFGVGGWVYVNVGGGDWWLGLLCAVVIWWLGIDCVYGLGLL